MEIIKYYRLNVFYDNRGLGLDSLEIKEIKKDGSMLDGLDE